ncbi:ArgP/LysG family DNA-binding transcriptional regulator [uncultured Tateyamaria sp.]|uniref:ArgP/LysG family DNA-binding transcriptional regulator n=1 Tax=uncultured Tateyamaria sp. TaxID=455651 RepID=UPI002612A727|nr:ArgP/LysG family DNA-binding transcriptional regulator [uncultured Tateyamaria sp.]
MFDYKLLNALWAVVREGSFEGAAVRLSITASAVSQRVKLLESRVGQVLVVRSKPCEATPMGYRLFAHMEQVKLLEQDVKSDFQTSGLVVGRAPVVLRVGVSGDSMNTWFNRVIAEFCTDEEVLIHILRDDREYTTEALKRGEAIATVTPRDRMLDGLKSLPLGRLEYSAVVSPGFHADAFPEGVTLASLSAVRGIAFDEKDSLPDLWIKHVFGGPTTIATHRVPSFAGYINACRAGIGWGIAPSLSVQGDIAAGRLVELFPEDQMATELVWQYSAISSDILKRLTRKVQQVAREILVR